ncbi:2146_t:CDS:2 [Ambispora leptoticha]|uniref:2146_t:CDS:1 n=1 Tax=Ambispora leptoticha TaxID=144679 RepID=A0A9N8YL84_9GLOM|nr:2146_t:CDS:2 [Ambispora leptoticha]
MAISHLHDLSYNSEDLDSKGSASLYPCKSSELGVKKFVEYRLTERERAIAHG